MFDSVQFSADVAELHALAARVASADVSQLSGELAVDALAEIHAAERQVQLASTTMIERVDRSGAWQADGSRSTMGYLRNALGESNGWARQRVIIGRALADAMPTVRATWAAGGIGLAHAGIIAGALADLDADLAADIERTLATAAPELTTVQLTNLAELIRQQAAPEESADKAQRDYERQYVSLTRSLDGQYDLRGRFNGETGSIIKQALDAFTRKPSLEPDSKGVPLEPQDAGFHRAQALAEMARQAIGHDETCATLGGTGRPTIIVTIDHDSLAQGYGAGEIEGHTVIGASAVRRLACESDLITKIIGSDGAMVDFGRRTRTISAALSAYLVSRDGGCVAPGCDAPAGRCQAHHIIHWINGGKTDRINLALLCAFHHHLVHDQGWIMSGNAEGDLYFLAPGDPTPRKAQRHSIIARAPDLLKC